MSLPLIMAGAQLAGGVVDSILTYRANKRNEENWRKQSAMNSAASQASRLRAAGMRVGLCGGRLPGKMGVTSQLLCWWSAL